MSEQYLVYLPHFHVIACRECQHGINKNELQKHFRVRHKHININARKKLNDYIKNLDIWEVKDVITPIKEVKVIKELKIYEGFICDAMECGHLRSTLKSIKEHCRSAHGWIKSKGTCLEHIPRRTK